MSDNFHPLWKNPLISLDLSKNYGLKISQSIIYANEYFYVFSLLLKILYQQNVKRIIELAKTLRLPA